MLKIVRLLLLLTLMVATSLTVHAQTTTQRIDVLTVKGTINPVLVDYIKRGIERAEEDNSVVLVIQLDTPGGLDTSMRDIVQDIVSARVPIVVFVSPSGARAASAGVFITMAAHVAAMAPNTAIGAAHPVAGSGQEIPETMEEKVVNDAAAYIRSIADAHGRNVDWAESAVRESVSATEQEALQLNVIDLVASDLDNLISRLDGRQVTMLDEKVITLDTDRATINRMPMNIAEEFLYAIADPNIAYLLLGLAMLGIITEVTHPGLIFPGVIGAISLLLAFYSLGTLPVNYAGVLLLVLAFGLFIAEVFTASFGLLAAGGLVSLIIGSLILFKGDSAIFRVSPWLIVTVTLIIGGFLAFAINRIIWAHRRQASTGREELIGKTAIVRRDLQPEGLVFLKGELWQAESESGTLKVGEEAVVTKTEGLKLWVTKKQ